MVYFGRTLQLAVVLLPRWRPTQWPWQLSLQFLCQTALPPKTQNLQEPALSPQTVPDVWSCLWFVQWCSSCLRQSRRAIRASSMQRMIKGHACGATKPTIAPYTNHSNSIMLFFPVDCPSATNQKVNYYAQHNAYYHAQCKYHCRSTQNKNTPSVSPWAFNILDKSLHSWYVFVSANWMYLDSGGAISTTNAIINAHMVTPWFQIQSTK